MQQPNQRHSNAEPAIGTIIPVSIVAVLLVAVLIGVVIRCPIFEPGIGDIIAFDAPTILSGGEPFQVSIAPAPNDAVQPASTCFLQPDVMTQSGGSLIVEGRQTDDAGSFLVHWSGAHTSLGGKDCGQSAELLLTPTDLLALASFAGGFGVDHRRMIFPPSNAAVPPTMAD
jgi:hypothetical protein